VFLLLVKLASTLPLPLGISNS